MQIFAVISAGEGELVDLRRLLSEAKSAGVLPVVVLRQVDSAVYDLSDAWHVIHTSQTGLSASRNVGLMFLLSCESAGPQDYVLFPDPDCVLLKEGVVSLRAHLISSHSELSVSPYSSVEGQTDHSRWHGLAGYLDAGTALRVTASAGLAVRLGLFSEIGLFDTQLGSGSLLAAGEDVEVVLRWLRAGGRVTYWPEAHQSHPYKAPAPRRSLALVALTRAYSELLGASRLSRALARAARIAASNNDLSLLRRLPIALRYRPQWSLVDKPVVAGRLLLTAGDPVATVHRVALAVASRISAVSVFAAHISALNAAQHDERFVSAFNEADFSFADGVSVVVAGRFGSRGDLRKRATTDYAPEIIQMLSEIEGRPARVGIVGGLGQTSRQAADTLELLANCDVVCALPGFGLSDEEVCESLRRENVDVLVLGLGMPKEAVWAHENLDASGCRLIITCGGWIRLLAGVEKRAPQLLQRLQLEWLWRAATDPGRTLPRYGRGLKTLGSLALESQKSSSR